MGNAETRDKEQYRNKREAMQEQCWNTTGTRGATGRISIEVGTLLFPIPLSLFLLPSAHFEDGHYCVDGDVLVGLVPAVVVSGHGEYSVAHLCLARKPGFRHAGHANDLQHDRSTV